MSIEHKTKHTTPLISIIVPTLNEGKALAGTLKAVRELMVYPYELIVSDGGSTDETVEIAKQYADLVVEHKDKKRQTIAGGRNAGAAAARGAYFVFIDADVEIPDINNFFTEAFHRFKDDIHMVAMTVFLKVFPKDATIADGLFFSVMNLLYYVYNNWLHIGMASGEFQMIKADAFRAEKGFNEALVAGEDADMFRRLAYHGVTKAEAGLHIFHTSRRAHAIGWPRLLTLWMLNNFFGMIFKKAFSKEWTVIR